MEGGEKDANEYKDNVAHVIDVWRSGVEPGDHILWGRRLNNLAFKILRLPGELREREGDLIFSEEFFQLALSYISKRKIFWTAVLVALGNMTHNPKIVPRLIRASTFQTVLLPLLMGNDIIVTETAATTQECAAWIIVNILQCYEGTVPHQFFVFIPLLISQAQREENDQLTMRSFRALCAIFSNEYVRKSFPDNYAAFRPLMSVPHLLESLLLEYRCGLENKAVPGTAFYPHAHDRALTVQMLTNWDEGRDAMVGQGAVELLALSLQHTFVGFERGSQMLWSRAIRALHNIALSKKHHRCLQIKELIDGLLVAAGGGGGGAPLVSWADRRLAATAVASLGVLWEKERLLWIAHIKPQDIILCPLRKLPAVLIRHVMMWLILFGVLEEDETSKLKTIKYEHS